MYFFLFFFFKQKTAYEIVPCDWSSDVCSSDLLQRADALRGDDRDAFRLTRKTKKLFIAGRLVLPHGCKMLVLVADEEDLPEILLWVGLDLGYAVQHRPLEVELHHYADSLRQAGVHADGEIQRAHLVGFDEPGERRQRLAVFIIRVGLRVVALLRRAKNPLHFRVVVEEGQEHRNPLDDRSPELRLDPSPGVMEPAL